ncbi:MAG: hypothetical protein IJZ56_00985 [Oscillospiraceae bacterium]|nr:hypothetical protein [Oscillospiraceae bacterium]
MSERNMFAQIQFMAFNRTALVHSLIDNEYRFELCNIGLYRLQAQH